MNDDIISVFDNLQVELYGKAEMLITRVELENIKNYDSVTYDFEPGITAISGPNGSGKTTIIESIAYALFDYLPYKKEDFLKRGATKGIVRITFSSAVDGREYTVYRDTANSYYIYDPITKGRLVEQKSQVANWIREHLGIDPRTDLRTLFISTIGVPQGNFTLEFAEQPAKRKIGFDKVLRVEDYQKASEALRPLIKLLDNKANELGNEIARLTLEVSPFDNLVFEEYRLEVLQNNLKIDLTQGEKELHSIRSQIEHLNELHSRIETLRHETQHLESQLEGLEKVKINLVEVVRISEHSYALVQRSVAGYSDYKNALAELGELEPLIIKRDAIRKQLASDEKEAVKIEVLIQSQKEKQKQIEKFKGEILAMTAMIEIQDEIEMRLRELQRELTEISVLSNKLESEEISLKMLRNEFKKLTSMIEEAEAQKEIVAKISELENQKKLIEDRVKKAQVTYEKLLLSKTQIKQSKESIEKLRGEIAILENEIHAGQGVEKIARRLPDLEYEGKNLIEEITIIKTTVQREEKVISEIQDGLCPLLSQKCLNMKEGERLDTFFSLQVNQEKKRMRELERQQENINRRIIDAKNALKKSSQLEAQRVHLERCQQDFSIVQNSLNNLLNEMKSLPKVENDVQALTQELETLNHELRIAREAQMKYQGLGMLKEQLERISDEGLQKKSYLNQIREILSHKESSEAEKAELESKLITLNDPRGRTKLLRIEIINESAVNANLQLLEEKEAKVQQVITTLSNELQVFLALDEEIAKVREKRAINKKDYEVFIENQPIAALLDARRLELNQIDSELKVIKQDLVQKGEILNDILNIYDDTKRNALSETLEGLLKKLATLTAERNAALMRLDELRVEIQKLLGIKQKIEEVNQEKDQNERLLLITEFIREILKNSGPHITEAHLKSISIEANQLYRDITGNPMVSLKWDPGYEIILEDGGFERSFASLSGGEQMSAALSVRLALLKELSDIRVAFFDEPTTNMDDERRRNLAEQIGRIKDLNQLFIISHDDTFESFTDQLIELKN